MNRSVFWVRSERRGPCAHLHLSGELDMSSTPTLERWFEEVEGDGSLGIVVNLQNLTFMDASGLHLLLHASDRAIQSGRSFAIANPPRIARRILEITKTTFLLDRPAVPQLASRMQTTMSDQAH